MGLNSSTRYWLTIEEGGNEDNLGYVFTSYDNILSVHQVGLVTQMVYDAYMEVVDISIRYDDFDNENMYEGEFLNAEVQRFDHMLASTNETIYDGAIELRL